ncbi:MAG: glucose-6-phosphate isomerase family protein [Candidatus Micrarchaeota archaeon]
MQLIQMELVNPPMQLELTDRFELMVEGQKHPVAMRTVRQMLDVLTDVSAARAIPGDMPLYYMFRDVKRKEDAALFESSHLRYDITVLPPMKIGSEFNKTYGHYHEMATSKLSYPELYEVMHGEAHYLLQQKQSMVSNEVLGVYLVHAKAGDKVLIPPNFGHTTINAGSETLVMDNLNEWKFKSDYMPYKQKRGAAFYYLQNEKKRNMAYTGAKVLREMPAHDFNRLANPQIALKIEEGKTYDLFLKKPELFDFLKDPTLIEFRQK